MARLCRQQERGRCQHQSPSVYLERARTSFRLSDRQRRQSRRLPRILQDPKTNRSVRQHDQDRTSPIARLSRLPVRQGQYNCLAAPCRRASRSLAIKGPSAGGSSCLRDAAYRIVYHAGYQHWRKGWRDMRFNMGSRGLWPQHNQFHAAWPHQDEQGPDNRADEHQREGRIGSGLQGQIDGQRNRISREAGCIGQKGAGETIDPNGDRVFRPCVPSHLRGLDGAGRHTNAEDRSISRPYENGRDRGGLRSIFPLIYEGCQRRRFVVIGTMVHRAVFRNGGKLVLLERIELSTSSLPMGASSAKPRNSAVVYNLFRQYVPFWVTFVPKYVHWYMNKKAPDPLQGPRATQRRRRAL